MNYGALLVAALGMLVAWLAFAPTAGAQNNSGADQYLENVPNPSGEKPGDKDSKGGGGKSGSNGGSGSSGSSGSGGDSGSGGAFGQGDTEDTLKGPAGKGSKDGTPGDQANATPGTENGDPASANVPSAAIKPPDDGDGGGGLSGGVIAFLAILLLGPLGFLGYRRVIAARRGIHTA